MITARYIDPGRPLVVLDITGGAVQGEYLYEGTGKPEVITLDFEADNWHDAQALLDLQRFRWETVEGAAVAIIGRTDHPDDMAAIAEWRRLADQMIVDATDETGDPS